VCGVGGSIIFLFLFFEKNQSSTNQAIKQSKSKEQKNTKKNNKE